MKIALSLCFAVLMASAVRAQILRPEAAGNHRAGRTDTHVRVAAHRGGGGYIHRDLPNVHAGSGSGHRSHGHGHRDYGYAHRSQGHWSHHFPRSHGNWYGHYGHRPSLRIGYGYHPSYDYSYSPGYDYGYYRGYDYGYYPSYNYGHYPRYGYDSYGTQGLFWGGLVGAIIGHNSGTFRHDAWRGAAWGAGAGWLLGSIADANRRAPAYQPAVVQSAPAVVQPAAQAQPQQVTIINNYYNAPATPMSAANGLFGRN